MNLPTIIIMGATGVGKSDFAEKLAREIGGEIINCDVGQFYTPLTIGTAKPDWKSSDIPQHMFDILDTPENYSVTAYRARVEQLIKEITARDKLPIIVGGSGFYVHALFFPPQDVVLPNLRDTSLGDEVKKEKREISWEELFRIDPERAQKIHPHDSYRITRALQLWDMTGVLPSEQKPLYKSVSDNTILVHVSREREELYERINARTLDMLLGSADAEDSYFDFDAYSGWVGEVKRLTEAWHEFLVKKGIIGYPEIISFLHDPSLSLPRLVSAIQKSTRNYAKRQITFWRMLSQKLKMHGYEDSIIEANLTLSPIDLYIRQLQKRVAYERPE